MQIAIYICLGFLLCLACLSLIIALRFYISHRVKAELKTYREELNRNLKAYYANAKTHLPENNANNLANSENLAHNSAQVQSESEPPFWNNKAKIKEARDRIAQGDKENLPTDPRFIGKTDLEVWRELDERYVELENVDEA